MKQAWGAYGAAYQSQLFEIGVFAAADAHEIPVPSHEIGEELAECFDAACGPLARRCIEAVERGEVLRTELDSFAPLTPTSIDPNGEERQLHERVLFADAGPKSTSGASPSQPSVRSYAAHVVQLSPYPARKCFDPRSDDCPRRDRG